MSSLSNSASTSGPSTAAAAAAATARIPQRSSSSSALRVHGSSSSDNLRRDSSSSSNPAALERRERRRSTLTGPDRKRRLVYPYQGQGLDGGASAESSTSGAGYGIPRTGGLASSSRAEMDGDSRSISHLNTASRETLRPPTGSLSRSHAHSSPAVPVAAGAAAGASYETAIDLSSSPLGPQPQHQPIRPQLLYRPPGPQPQYQTPGPPPPPRSRDGRQSSWSNADGQFVEYNRPLWQPDIEVTECPICRTPFSFWYRKHHCRKCGRVVCSSCSPHRITIPRQYIVHPPNIERSSASALAQRATQIANFEDEAPQSPVAMNPALGGGEEVRLCNPCVPDPNPEPPLGYPVRPDIGSAAGWSRHRSYHSLSTPRQHPYSAIPESFTRPSRRTVGSSDYPGFTGFGGAYAPSLSGRPLSYGSSSSGLPYNASRNPFPFSRPVPNAAPESSSRAHAHPPRRHSRHIDENDLCPICDSELPPLGANGNEDAREAHIRECISNHGRPASGSPVSQAPLPVRMLAYTATEKDCIGQDGGEQECTICMEEYEVGQSLVRLECLCKFHKRCIVEWFERRKECPVHKTS